MANNTNTFAFNLRSVLEKNKLNTENFLDWERNLIIVLRTTAAERRARQPTLDTSVQITCLMLACMTPYFQKRFDGMDAYSIIVQLKTMFHKHARLERFEAHRKLLECKLAKGKHVGPHVFNLIGHFQIMEKLGFPYLEELAIDILHGMLIKAERNLPNDPESEHKDVLMVRKGKSFKKVGAGPYSKKDKGKEVCFYCKEIGHWKRNCPKYLEDKKNGASTSGIFVIEVNLTTSASWVFDIGCGTHIICNVQGLKRSRILEKREKHTFITLTARSIKQMTQTRPICGIVAKDTLALNE
ncbi:hypothetical protein RND81_08G153200 [Saponaria officinalis]|uniref:CCHC-type domain-containing protein n=1 Tax=Saponaria officinalis TaxID=3572 RepID=A0AAW1J7V9_SAPOF